MNIRIDDSEDLFKKMIITSLIFHGAIVLIFTIKTLVFPSENIEYQPAIRVDLVALPDKIKPPAPDVVEEKKVEPIPEPKPIEKPKEVKINPAKAKTEAFNKLKKLQAFDNLKKMKDENTEAKEKTEPAFKGNILSPGTALRGLDKLQYDEYIEKMRDHVYKNWNLPEWILRLNLKANVLVKIDKNGFVTEKTFIQASGNPEFDRLVMETLETSSPFPPPPEKMQALVGIEGVKLGFPE